MNVTLIGMPGSGKSTVGKYLSEMLGFYFLDTDKYIEDAFGMRLQEVVDTTGCTFGTVEETKTIEATGGAVDTVIATGGSIVYSNRAMQHLSDTSLIVFLDVPERVLIERIMKQGPRGIDYRGHSDFHGLFLARRALYQRWADIVLFGVQTAENTAASIAAIAQTFMSLEAMADECPAE